MITSKDPDNAGNRSSTNDGRHLRSLRWAGLTTMRNTSASSARTVNSSDPSWKTAFRQVSLSKMGLTTFTAPEFHSKSPPWPEKERSKKCRRQQVPRDELRVFHSAVRSQSEQDLSEHHQKCWWTRLCCVYKAPLA